MPIKKRKEIIHSVDDYHTYRMWYWHEQDKSLLRQDGPNAGRPHVGIEKTVDLPVLEPKKNLFFKDIWHCKDAAAARRVVQAIAKYSDITYIELKGSWVWVEWNHTQKSHHLEGQATDDRSRVTG